MRLGYIFQARLRELDPQNLCSYRYPKSNGDLNDCDPLYTLKSKILCRVYMLLEQSVWINKSLLISSYKRVKDWKVNWETAKQFIASKPDVYCDPCHISICTRGVTLNHIWTVQSAHLEKYRGVRLILQHSQSTISGIRPLSATWEWEYYHS